jgi:hypothetical protein
MQNGLRFTSNFIWGEEEKVLNLVSNKVYQMFKQKQEFRVCKETPALCKKQAVSSALPPLRIQDSGQGGWKLRHNTTFPSPESKAANVRGK